MGLSEEAQNQDKGVLLDCLQRQLAEVNPERILRASEGSSFL
jgi:hypothetical protein